MSQPPIRIRASITALVAVLLPGTGAAQSITIDGRLSPARTLVGPSYTIDATVGRQVGGNLFHSFGKFGLSNGESATFTAAGASAPIGNVIGRVTGGAPSSIDGKIQSTIPGANLYLINPSGVVFGPNATVSVSGSLHVGTADYVRFNDGARFQASNSDSSTFSAAPPAAFGFFNAAPARITVNGSNLTAAPGQTLGFAGGPISVDRAALSAPAGNIRLTSVAGTGEVRVASGAAGTATSSGSIDITGSTLNVGDPANSGSGGAISIRGGRVALASGEISADNFGSGLGGRIKLRSDSLMSLSGGLSVHADAQASGSGGNISIRAGSLSLNSATVQSNAFRSGKGGDIDVAVSGGATLDASAGPTAIGTATGRSSSGQSGNVTLIAGPLLLTGGATISSLTRGVGNSGTVNVTSEALTMASRSQISSNTSGSGAAGNVAVTTGSLSMTDPFTQISSSTSDIGHAGSVAVSATDAMLSNLAEINAGTLAAGDGGTVRVNVTGDLSILGPLRDNPFLTGISSVADPGSTGNAGSVFVAAGRLSISGFAAEISSSTLGSGRAGDVRVDVAGPLSITGPTGQFPTGVIAESLQSPPFVSTGNAGDVSVSAQSIALVAGGAIASRTTGTGAGGTVSVATPGPLLLDGMGVSGTQIAGSATGPQSGPAGQVTVNAGSLTIRGGGQIASSTFGPGKGGDIVIEVASDAVLPDPGAPAQISASSRGAGDAGSITLTAVNLRMNDGASISTDAATANGGNITLRVRDLMYLVDSQITTSVKGASGNGGNILIDPHLLVLQHSSIIAQAVRGHGGDITIVADQFLPSADSIVSATSQLGISGTVELIGPRVDLNGSLVVLSSELRGAAEVLRDSCAARSALPRSSLTQAGRGGLPQDPEALIPALYFAGRSAEPEVTGASALSSTLFAQLRSVRVTAHCGT